MSLADVISDLEDIDTDLIDIIDYLKCSPELGGSTLKDDVIAAQSLISRVTKDLRNKAK